MGTPGVVRRGGELPSCPPSPRYTGAEGRGCLRRRGSTRHDFCKCRFMQGRAAQKRSSVGPSDSSGGPSGATGLIPSGTEGPWGADLGVTEALRPAPTPVLLETCTPTRTPLARRVSNWVRTRYARRGSTERGTPGGAGRQYGVRSGEGGVPKRGDRVPDETTDRDHHSSLGVGACPWSSVEGRPGVLCTHGTCSVTHPPFP